MAPSASTDDDLLVLIPTALERDRLLRAGPLPLERPRLELCGFGLAAASARAAATLATARPRRVLLLGIAGTYDPRALPVGAACGFGRVRVDGIGARGAEPADLLLPSALGFAQWSAEGESASSAIHEELALAPLDERDAERELLTVCAATGAPDQVPAIRARHPRAAAEDMEAFGVALACALFAVPLTVVRGVSNVVGERDPRGWKIDEALAAIRELLASHRPG